MERGGKHIQDYTKLEGWPHVSGLWQTEGIAPLLLNEEMQEE